MRPTDYEIFKFSENLYEPYPTSMGTYWLNNRTYLDIVLTDRCNANCNFCIADLIHKKLDCNFEIFQKKILYAIEHLNVKEVLLLGGEPTVSKDLIPMIQWLSTLGLDKIVMTTNGIKMSLDAEFRREVLQAGLTDLNVSFMNTDVRLQKEITNARTTLHLTDIANIHSEAVANHVRMRVNTNVFRNNNATLESMLLFYRHVRYVSDSVKFSPLLPTDAFSVIDKKTAWVTENRLEDNEVYKLFTDFEGYFSDKGFGIIENNLQFGFVKNTMIPLTVPVILNWNFGEYTGMMKHVTDKKQINNIKLLPNNELSLSWNREASEWFIYTE